MTASNGKTLQTIRSGFIVGLIATALLTVNPARAATSDQEALALLGLTFRAGWEVQDTLNEANDIALQAIFLASELNGNQLTGAGTLTETAPGTEEFVYSPPADTNDPVLHVMLSNGVTIGIQVSAFRGDTGNLAFDDWKLFEGEHTDFAYSITSPQFNIQVQSQITQVEHTRWTVAQAIKGTVTSENEIWTVAAQITGEKTYFHNISGSANQSNSTHSLNITGSASTENTMINMSQQQNYARDFFANSGDAFTKQTDRIASMGNKDQLAIEFGDAFYRYNDSSDIDPIWEAGGTVFRSGEIVGKIVVNSSDGVLSLQLNDGQIVEF